MKVAHKNVTLSLPEPLVQRLKVFAASRNRSMTNLAAEAIERLMDQNEDREEIKKRIIERMRNARSLGTGGVIPWTRDEIHQRGVR